jgi:hypothetical protein
LRELHNSRSMHGNRSGVSGAAMLRSSAQRPALTVVHDRIIARGATAASSRDLRTILTTMGRSTVPKTMAMQSLETALEQALDNMRLASPPVPFAGRWHLLHERKRGGQALVQV